MSQNSDNFNRFLTTYNGRELLGRHSLDEYGHWEVYGEDPNCDLGGPHSNPYLGLLEGMLCDAITEAVELSGFWQWGGGGEIKKASQARVRAVGKARILAPDLFALITQKTHEGKIEWMHRHDPDCGELLPDGFSDCPDSRRLTGWVPNNNMTLLLECDRSGLETLTLSLNGETITVAFGDEVAALRKRVLEQPVEDAVTEAAIILKNL